MNDTCISRRLLTALIAAVLALPAVAAWAASGSERPGTHPPQHALPDLAPTRLFFDRVCDLKGELRNQGAAPFSGTVDSRLTHNGQTIATLSTSVSLMPGAKTVVKLAPRAQLGVWVNETASWGWTLDYTNKIKETSDGNNSITISRKCSGRTP
jgi:hypothetical protein